MKKEDLTKLQTQKVTDQKEIEAVEDILKTIPVSGYVPNEFEIKKIIFTGDLKALLKKVEKAHFNKTLNRFDITFYMNNGERFYASGDIK